MKKNILVIAASAVAMLANAADIPVGPAFHFNRKLDLETTGGLAGDTMNYTITSADDIITFDIENGAEVTLTVGGETTALPGSWKPEGAGPWLVTHTAADGTVKKARFMMRVSYPNAALLDLETVATADGDVKVWTITNRDQFLPIDFEAGASVTAESTDGAEATIAENAADSAEYWSPPSPGTWNLVHAAADGATKLARIIIGSELYDPAKFHTVTWLNIDDSVLATEEYYEGSTPRYKNGTPEYGPTEDAAYTFTGWTPEITVLGEEDVTYKAVYNLSQYEITWLAYDGTLIEKTQCAPGKVPTHAGAVPAGSGSQSYYFVSWYPFPKAANGDATYTARIGTRRMTALDLETVYTEENGTRVYTLTSFAQLIDMTWKAGASVSETCGDETRLLVEAALEEGYGGYVPPHAGTWNLVHSVAGSKATEKARYIIPEEPDLYADEKLYTTTWKNDDGTTLGTNRIYEGLTNAWLGNDPEKDGSSDEAYSFAGWTPATGEAAADAEFTAIFAPANSVKITWLYDDGTVADTTYVAEGKMPSHAGVVRESAGATYKFYYWTPEIVRATEEATYKAFTSARRTTALDLETVPVKNNAANLRLITDWNQLLDVTWEEGASVEVEDPDGAVSTIASAASEGSIDWEGTKPGTWTLAHTLGTTVQTAPILFSEELFATVKWVDEDGTLLQIDYHLPGETPSHEPLVDYSDERTNYVFTGWSPEIVATQENVTYVYTAVWEKTEKTYTVVWKMDDGSVIKTDTGLSYDTTPSCEDPVKESTDPSYVYEFAGWTPEVSNVFGDAEYTAQFTQRLVKETVEIDDDVVITADPDNGGGITELDNGYDVTGEATIKIGATTLYVPQGTTVRVNRYNDPEDTSETPAVIVEALVDSGVALAFTTEATVDETLHTAQGTVYGAGTVIRSGYITNHSGRVLYIYHNQAEATAIGALEDMATREEDGAVHVKAAAE
ncbi:MAG: hypothetical protein E7049_02720 [Lentisphaerae bacterium]|nr:hypothetical protein [Lentisphaerota bacterium]